MDADAFDSMYIHRHLLFATVAAAHWQLEILAHLEPKCPLECNSIQQNGLTISL